MKNPLYSGLFFRILIISALLMLSLALIFNGYRYSSLLAAVIIIMACAEMYFFIRSRLLFYDKTITSILHDDFSAGFPEEFRTQGYKSLYDLFHVMKQRQYEQVSREAIYLSILNNVESGILILQKDGDGWNVFLMNDHFSKLFGVPKLKKWEYLKNYLPSLCTEIENINFAELKSSVNIAINGNEPQTFVMQTSVTRQYENEYFVVLLDSIQRVIERKEKEAWVNLMKIISHELMNSLTPIRSLSQSLRGIVSQDSITQDDVSDIRESLDTIVGRTDHLQRFVENYRKLTILPTPDKAPMDLSELIRSCIKIMAPEFAGRSITIENKTSEKILLNADRSQIEQVLINLLTNSMHAMNPSGEKKIEISDRRENGRIFLEITDTGQGIETGIRDKVFLPFFTTRKDGAGIGLTLSKNIVEAHGGYLSFEVVEKKTRFVVVFIER